MRRAFPFLLIFSLLLAACPADDPEVADPPEDVNEVDEVDEPDEVTIRLVSSFVREAVEHEGFWEFVDILEETAPWVTIDYRGGPEAIPSLQQGEAVADGAVDMATLPATFYIPMLPINRAFKLSTMTPPEEREAGAFDVYQEHHEQVGLHFLGKVNGPTPFRLFSNVELDALDLSGLDIRVSPVYVQVVDGLGGTPVEMAPGDVFTALERGVVDGYGWAGVGLLVHGWQDVTEYEIDIDFYEMDMVVVVNRGFWDGLDERTREAITDAMIQAESAVVDLYERRVQEELEARRDAGIDPLEFTPEEEERFLEIAYERGWDEAIEAEPDAERLRDIYGMPTD
jgi:TRAP-type transport system periplasmic protein